MLNEVVKKLFHRILKTNFLGLGITGLVSVQFNLEKKIKDLSTHLWAYMLILFFLSILINY